MLEPCPHCNRTFRPESLKFHLKACTADKPLKPPIIREKDENGKTITKIIQEKKTPLLGLQAR